MIGYTIPVEVDGQGNGRAPLPEPVDEPLELAIGGHAGANATVRIEGDEVVIEGARPWGYFNATFHVLQEHDMIEPYTDEPRDAPRPDEIEE